MSEKSEQLKARNEAFAIAVVKFCDTMPNSIAMLASAGKPDARDRRALKITTTAVSSTDSVIFQSVNLPIYQFTISL